MSVRDIRTRRTGRLPEERFKLSLPNRRTRERVALRCQLRLYRPERSETFEGETLDLSVGGFYCIVKEDFSPGESLKCILTLPAGDTGFDSRAVGLDCKVEVMRVEPTSQGFGVACRIDRYSVIVPEPS